MKVTVVTGDLLEQKTEAIVNPWNRNVIPFWLLSPHGVSGAIKKKAGLQPFRELAKFGVLNLGSAVYTSAGTLPFKAIIHVATIGTFGRSSLPVIRNATINALKLGEELNLNSIAFPLLGSGSAGLKPEIVEQAMREIFEHTVSNIEVVLVQYNNLGS